MIFVLIGTLAFIIITCLVDLVNYANGKQVNVFYVPIAVELAIFACGWIILFFEVPERWTRA
jgi:hypothetical protein